MKRLRLVFVQHRGEYQGVIHIYLMFIDVFGQPSS